MRRSFRRGSAWDADLLADQARSCPALDGKPCRRSGPLLTDANAVSVVLPPAAGGRACGGGGVRETGAPAHSARSGSPFHSPAATARFNLPNIDGEPLWLSAGCLPVVHLAGYLGRLAYGDVTAPALTDTCGAYATVQSSSAGASLGNDSTKVHSICRSRVGIVLYLFSSPAPTDSHAPPRNQNQSETRRPFLP